VEGKNVNDCPLQLSARAADFKPRFRNFETPAYVTVWTTAQHRETLPGNLATGVCSFFSDDSEKFS